MIPYKMIYTINMHTTVYQFWRFVYHHEQSVIDYYARISIYMLSFCTKIGLHVYNLWWTRPKYCVIIRNFPEIPTRPAAPRHVTVLSVSTPEPSEWGNGEKVEDLPINYPLCSNSTSISHKARPFFKAYNFGMFVN